MKEILALLFALISPIVVFSQKYSNEFLAIGVGARAQGMAGAQTALCNDVTAAYWNPAALSRMESPYQLGGQHAEWFAGIAQYDYLSFGKVLDPERHSVMAVSLIRLGIDNIPYTINLVNADGTVNYDNVTQFSAADYALIGSYARSLKNPAFRIGGNVKVIRRVIGDLGNSWGFGTDLGIHYQKGNWLFGAMGRDITTTFNAWSFSLTDQEKQVFEQTGNAIPESNTEITLPRVEMGAARLFQLSRQMVLKPAIDLVFTTDGQRNVLVSSNGVNMDLRAGAELDYKSLVQARLGVGNFQRIQEDFNPDQKRMVFQPNFGIGLTLGKFQIDYALTNIGNLAQIQYSHIFSIRMNIRQLGRSQNAN
jgi:hypothetical protein